MKIKTQIINLVTSPRHLFRLWLMLLVPVVPVSPLVEHRLFSGNREIHPFSILLFAYGCKYGLWRIRGKPVPIRPVRYTRT